MKTRPGTWDKDIALSVLGRNEYGLPPRMDGQVVLDIGAHIGTFVTACAIRRAAVVVAYEPDPENFEILKINAGEVQTPEGADTDAEIILCNHAVCGADGELSAYGYRRSDHDYDRGRNTGHVEVLYGESDGDHDFEVQAVGINDVIKAALDNSKTDLIDLVKIDCEGGEWDILAHGDFSKVRLIVGELHRPDTMGTMEPAVAKMQRRLRRQGFDVEVNYESSGLAHFMAINSELADPRKKSVEVREPRQKPRLLWWGDAEVPTGYARVTSNICSGLAARDWDVHVLGIGYDGDPVDLPYSVYPAHKPPFGQSIVMSDPWGNARIKDVLARVKPDLLLIQNDHWIVADSLGRLAMDNVWIPTVGYVAIDSENVKGESATQLNNTRQVITHTDWGAGQLKLAGYRKPCVDIPHGVDVSKYYPVDRHEARELINIKGDKDEAFIFGYVNANQPRKRLDLAIAYWAAWWKQAGSPENVWLYLHSSGNAWDVPQLLDYHGIRGRVIASIGASVPESHMPTMYSALDCVISTSEGESFGLTTLEAMACGVPNIAVRCGGMPEWAGSAVRWVDPSYYAFTPNRTNTKRAIACEADYVAAMQDIYTNEPLRETLRTDGLALAHRLSWDSAVDKFNSTLRSLVDQQKKATAQDVLAEFA